MDVVNKNCVNDTGSPIANCTKHVKDTTYKCAECDDTTYLNAAPGTYEADCDAPNTITNCETYEKDSD